MVVSLRRTIIAALVAQLNTITVANGYVTDLGLLGRAATPTTPRSSLSVLPVAVVSAPEEDKREPTQTYYECDLDVVVDAFAVELGDGGGVEDKIDELVSDIERALLLGNAMDPPFAVAGFVDLVLMGHDKWALDDVNVAGASIGCRVRYRHSVTDPSVFP